MLLETSSVHQHSAADAKIRLFRSLFRGRDDVYPRRSESRKTGKSGYAPACGNEWVQGICEKPRIKCAECQYRQFLPLSDAEAYRRDRRKDRLLQQSGYLEELRAGRIGEPELAEMLGLPRIAVDGFLKSHGIFQTYSIEDFEQDRETLKNLGF